MLYHGVNKITDGQNGGRLIPKGNCIDVSAKADGKIMADGAFMASPCKTNAARAHQIESYLYDNAGISTSRSEKTAIRFATTNYCEEGFIYVIDEAILPSANVTAYEFTDPRYPHEQEVTLIEKSGGALPSCIIIQKYSVGSDGSRT